MTTEEEQFEDEEVVYETEVPILKVCPSDSERGNVFSSFLTMRNESSFCDVAFLVQGTLFRAHRVVVSSWSRWLFALLSEGPDQEIVSLDVFTPNEFGAVLDYMYGEPLEFALANAEPMLKIIRRLELRGVEQKCWRFLLSIVNHENCVKLHQIADFFECAPLKISAWRIIQESKPGYSSAPTHMINTMQANANNANIRGHGLTGPGEMDAMSHQNEDNDDSDDDDAEFSIFTATTPTGYNGGSQSELADEGLLGSINKRYDHYVHPDKLPKGTPAIQVVKAWSFRLQEVFAECCGDSNLTIAEHAAGMSVAESKKSDTESVQEEDVKRQISSFSVATERPAGDSGNETPILTQPLPKRKPRDEKNSPGLVRFTQVPENDENLEENRVHQEEQDHHASNSVDWKEELTKFYIANNLKDKIQSIDTILEAWHGRELDMMEVLHDKYNVMFDEDLRNRLSQ